MDIARPIMEKYPFAWLYFVPFILITTFTMLNLFIAIIVSAMQSQSEEESVRTRAVVQASTDAVDRTVHDELTAIRGELALLRSAMEAGKTRVDR
jgi:voltage-gated sodium channel